MSNFLALNSKDLWKGLLVAVLAPVVTTIANAMNVPGFDFASFDWKSVIAIGVSAGLAYLLKNLSQDNQGNVFGIGSR
jgi:hypothetical protein